VISAVRLGTFTPLLLLAVAAAWRWRDERWVAGTAIGLGIAIKVFVWPLALWLLFTRRYAAAALSAGLAMLLTVVTWAAIGFDGVSVYPDLVRTLADVVAARGYSLVAFADEVGLPRDVADVAPPVVGLTLTLLVLAMTRAGAEERVTYSLATLATLVFTPIVWLHYFTLLVVPLSLARPRFTPVWALLWLFWLTPVQENFGDLWRILLAAGVSVSAGAWAVWSGRLRAEARV
jgi:hypothetical protein